jgi:hypothetical protein
MFLAALAGVAGSLIGGALNNSAADKQADAISSGNEQAIALQRDQFEWLKNQMQPSIDRGDAAGDLYGASFGLTPTNFRASGAVPNAIAPRGGYQTGSGIGNIGPLYYQPFGQNGGNGYPVFGMEQNQTLPYLNTPSQSEPRTDSATGLTEGSATDYQNQAYDRFMGSGYNKAATEISQSDFDTIQGGMGAAGKLFSGSAAGAMSDRLAGNRYGAYFDYQNALAGLSGAGQNATSAVGAAGQNYANSAGNALMNIGDARATSYGQQHANTMNALGNIAGSVGGFF